MLFLFFIRYSMGTLNIIAEITSNVFKSNYEQRTERICLEVSKEVLGLEARSFITLKFPQRSLIPIIS